ncbi:MAG: hypothetical protein JHD16_00205 [Solirubrobacteraceae bacterium]|nr:hypothetical protein [Solirubrobacteraceae bacterium]
MSKEVTLAEYYDENGDHHRVCGQWDANRGGYRVLDIGKDSRIVVDTLLGVGDDSPQAGALAADYAREMARWVAGDRHTHPLPPREVATPVPEVARAEHPRLARADHQPIAA